MSRFFINPRPRSSGSRFPHQIPHHNVIFHEAAFLRNVAQHRFEHVFLAGKFLHFTVGKLRRLKHRERHYFRAIANQDGALFFVAFQRELDSPLYVETVDFLQRIFTLCLAAAGFPWAPSFRWRGRFGSRSLWNAAGVVISGDSSTGNRPARAIQTTPPMA